MKHALLVRFYKLKILILKTQKPINTNQSETNPLVYNVHQNAAPLNASEPF